MLQAAGHFGQQASQDWPGGDLASAVSPCLECVGRVPVIKVEEARTRPLQGGVVGRLRGQERIRRS